MFNIKKSKVKTLDFADIYFISPEFTCFISSTFKDP